LFSLLVGLISCSSGNDSPSNSNEPPTNQDSPNLPGDGGTNQPGDGGTDQPGNGGSGTSYTVNETFTSYFGGSLYERVQGAFIDGQGVIYIVGSTHSSNFPATANTFQSVKPSPQGASYDDSDGFVAKISADGSSIIWASYLGGSARESAYGVRVDSSGNVYVVGSTGSPDFPTTAGAYDETFNGPAGTSNLSDSFVAKFDPNGQLLFSTFVGGASATPNPSENPRGAIHIDETRNRIYVAGGTGASDYPTTPGSYQTSFAGGDSDAFVFALSTNGSQLIASTLFGGSGSDGAPSNIVQHSDGSVYIAGGTTSSDFPITPNAYQTTIASGLPTDSWTADGDVFVARLSADLDQLVFSTYIGGSDVDAASHNQGLAIDSNNRPVVYVDTKSFDYPTTAGAYSGSYAGGYDTAVSILSEDGSSLVASTFLSGSGDEQASGIFVGPGDRVYLSGETTSLNFPVTAQSFQTTYGGGGIDIYVTILTPDLSSLFYSTYLGGSGPGSWHERGRTVWVNDTLKVIVGGVTDSSDFPILGTPLQMNYGGGQDGILFGLELVEQ
jgi:hypothetical protein